MDSLTNNSLELYSLDLCVDNRAYPIFNLDLSLAVNNIPVCNIALSAASADSVKIDQECKICLKHSKGTTTLFSGYISAEASNIATYTSHIENYKTFTVSIITEAVDAIPPTAWIYLTNAVDSENLVVQGITKVGKGAYGKTEKELAVSSKDKNIAKLILDTLDKLQDNIRNNITNNTKSISKYFVNPDVILNAEGAPESIPRYINNKSRALLLSGATYMQVIQTLCQDFYLSILPSVEKEQYKLQLTHINTWGDSQKTIKLSEYSAIYTSHVSIKNRLVDGVLMPIYDTTGRQVTDTGLFVFYGQKSSNSGAVMEITDIKSAEGFFKNNTGSLRYKQIPLPTWLVGNAPDTTRNNAKRVVKEYFATYAYANYQVSLGIPYHVYDDLRTYLGKVVSIEMLDDGKIIEQTSKKSGKKRLFKGVLQGLNINIRLVSSKLAVSCNANVSHVRSETVDKLMKFKNTDKLYK